MLRLKLLTLLQSIIAELNEEKERAQRAEDRAKRADDRAKRADDSAKRAEERAKRAEAQLKVLEATLSKERKRRFDMMNAMNMGFTAEKLFSMTDLSREDLDKTIAAAEKALAVL